MGGQARGRCGIELHQASGSAASSTYHACDDILIRVTNIDLDSTNHDQSSNLRLLAHGVARSQLIN